MSCQICMESYDELDSTVGRVQNLCQTPTCTADICVPCLTRCIQTALADAPTGTLPRIRCPICLVRINFAKWAPHIKESWLKHGYNDRGEIALGFRTPCCDNTEYTHLPFVCPVSPDQKLLDSFESPALKFNVGDLFTEEDAMRFKQLVIAFNDYREEAGAVVQYIIDHRDDADGVEEAIDFVLPCLYDPERRATLMLAYLYRYPRIYTTCCDTELCFNCKGVHDEDSPCESDEGFSMVDCVVRCRSCRVMLVKTEGCDSVYCLCGREMAWTEEVQLRKQHKQGLLPVDIYDAHRVKLYLDSKGMIAHLGQKYAEWRKKQLDRLIQENERSLQKLATRVQQRRARREEPTLP